MKKPTDQDYARHLLNQRASGYSIAYVLKRSKVRYGIHLAIILGFLVLFCASYDMWIKGFSLWAVGMYLGALLRDLGWLRRIKRTWPFTVKITDWAKVEAMAEGKPLVDEDLEATPATS